MGNILRKSDLQVTENFLHGDQGDNHSNNVTGTLILIATIDFLIATKELDVPLF